MGRSSRTVTFGLVVATGIVAAISTPVVAAAAPAPVVAATLSAPSLLSARTEFAPAATATVTPGALMITQVDARTLAECTADFVFTDGASTFVGMAAHCAGAGPSDDLTGCTAPTLPLGTAVTIQGRNGRKAAGTLAYSSWRTMQKLDVTDDDLCAYNDFALVRISPTDAADVNPSVPELGGPTGLDSDGLTTGEAVYSFQPNNGGSGLKSGKAQAPDPSDRTHRVVITPPGIPGDSGAGFLDADGKAFGVLSTQFYDSRHTNGVADLALALAYADAHGGLGDITLVPGTEPFQPTAAGSAA